MNAVASVKNNYYVQHYFDLRNAGKYLLAALAGLAIVMALILIVSHSQRRRHKTHLIESFYELVFASTSVLLFLSLYNYVDWHMPDIWALWNTYSDLILMAFLVMSVIFTNFCDRLLIRLDRLSAEEKSSLRLVSTLYVIGILGYIKFIYKDSNYDNMIIYFVALFISRFVYFDFTWGDFACTLLGVLRLMPLLALLGIYSGVMCWFGFRVGFLLTSNGVLISTLIAHLFMILSILILDKTRLIRLFV